MRMRQKTQQGAEEIRLADMPAEGQTGPMGSDARSDQSEGRRKGPSNAAGIAQEPFYTVQSYGTSTVGQASCPMAESEDELMEALAGEQARDEGLYGGRL